MPSHQMGPNRQLHSDRRERASPAPGTRVTSARGGRLTMRYAAVGRRLLRDAQQRMIQYGQDIPAQGAAEVF